MEKIIKIQVLTEDDARTWKHYKFIEGQKKAIRIKKSEFMDLTLRSEIEVGPPLYVTNK